MHVTLGALVTSVGTQKYIHMKTVRRRLTCHLVCKVCLIEQALANAVEIIGYCHLCEKVMKL